MSRISCSSRCTNGALRSPLAWTRARTLWQSSHRSCFASHLSTVSVYGFRHQRNSPWALRTKKEGAPKEDSRKHLKTPRYTPGVRPFQERAAIGDIVHDQDTPGDGPIYGLAACDGGCLWEERTPIRTPRQNEPTHIVQCVSTSTLRLALVSCQTLTDFLPLLRANDSTTLAWRCQFTNLRYDLALLTKVSVVIRTYVYRNLS